VRKPGYIPAHEPDSENQVEWFTIENLTYAAVLWISFVVVLFVLRKVILGRVYREVACWPTGLQRATNGLFHLARSHLGTFQLVNRHQISITDAFRNRARDAFNVLSAGMPAVVTTRL
jgi:hypothetical protein